MNTALRFNSSETLISQWARVAPVSASSFTGRSFPSDRLKAFASRFSPSKESWLDRVAGIGATLAAYAGIAFAAQGLTTLHVAQIVHALHLNGV